MGLLDDLKKQAEALKEEQKAMGEEAQRRRLANRQSLEEALQRLHRYLDDLVEQLKVVSPTITADFSIKGGGSLKGLRQGEYLLSDLDTEHLSFRLGLTLRSSRRYQFEIHGSHSIEPWLNEVKSFGLDVFSARLIEDAAGQRARVVLEGVVPVSLSCRGDTDAGHIVLVIRNYDALGDRRHFVRPEAVDDLFLDELARYILREDNRFLVEDVPAEYRERLRRRLEQDRRSREAERAQGVSDFVGGDQLSTRFRSLFTRKPMLKLEFQGQVREVSTLTSGVTLGRGSTCDVVVNHKLASRAHARIEWRNDEFVITDQSTNGTYLRLADGQIVRLRRQSMTLKGSGLIGLGMEITKDNPLLIRFSV
jgi:hypothetical protein